jgi:hypothetical protein
MNRKNLSFLMFILILLSLKGYSFNLEDNTFSSWTDPLKLSNLQLNEGKLEPKFHPDIEKYRVELSFNILSVKLTPFTSSDESMVFIEGEEVKNGNTSKSIYLNPGLNQISIEVRLQDGKKRTYFLIVNRNVLTASESAAFREMPPFPFATSIILYMMRMSVVQRQKTMTGMGCLII